MTSTVPSPGPARRAGLLDHSHQARPPTVPVLGATVPDEQEIVVASLPIPPAAPTLSPPQVLWRLLPPGENSADLTVAEHCLSAAFGQEAPQRGWKQRQSKSPVTALELHAEAARVDFALRGTVQTLQRAVGQLVAGYRQLEPDPVPPEADPLLLQPGEAASFAVLSLAEPAALPLQTPTPRPYGQQVDPLVGFIHALARTPAPLRVVSQLCVSSVAPGWSRRYERLLAHLNDRRRLFQPSVSAGASEQELALLGLLGIGLLLVPLWLLHGLLLALWWVFLFGALGLSLGGVIWWVHAKRQEQRLIIHAQACADKLRRPAVRTCLRLYVLGPAPGGERQRWINELLDHLGGAYAGANRLVVGRRGEVRPEQLGQPSRDQHERAAMRHLEHAFHPASRWARFLFWLRGDRAFPILSTNEVAALWHFPQAADDLPYLALQPSQQRLPPPGTFTIALADVPPLPPAELANPLAWPPEVRDKLAGLYVGTTRAGGQTYPVRFPWPLLDRHLALVGATGSGKSSLIEQILRWAALDPKTVVFCFDPHGDLAERLPGLLSRKQIEQGHVVLLDPTDAFPIGIPSLWDPFMTGNQVRQEQLVSNLVNTMERLSGEAWGFRVRANFYAGLTTLLAASTADDEEGQAVYAHTLLDVWDLFTRKAFRDQVLGRLTQSGRHTLLRGVFTYQLDTLAAAQQLQEVASVLNRIVPLLFTAGGRLLGQRHPSLSLDEVIQQRRWCLINLGNLGEDASRLVGSLLLSYIHASLRNLRALPFEERPRVLLVIDELQAFDPNALSGLFGEVRKFGGRIIGATNSLAELYEQSPRMARELSANIGTWIAGRIGADDAALVLKHMQGEVKGSLGVRDLVTLPEGNFFVRALVEQQTRSLFRLTLPPLAPANAELERLALDESRKRYGRPAEEVEWEVYDVALRFEGTRLAELLAQQKRRAAQEARRARAEKSPPSSTREPPKPDPEQAESAAAAAVRRVAQFETKTPPRQKAPRGMGRAAPSKTNRSHPRAGKHPNTLHHTAFTQGTIPTDEQEDSA